MFGMFGHTDNNDALNKDLKALQRMCAGVLEDHNYSQFIEKYRKELYYELTSVAGVGTLTNATLLADTIEQTCPRNRKGEYVPARVNNIHIFIKFVQEQVPWF